MLTCHKAHQPLGILSIKCSIEEGYAVCTRAPSNSRAYIRGPQHPGHRQVLVRGLLGTKLHSRRWAVGEWAKLHLYLQSLPIACITVWAPPPIRSVVALDSHRSTNPTVNYACEGSRLCAAYETLIPDDLRWSWGSDASAGEWLQIQIIISREVWLHRDHNKSIACRHIKTLSVGLPWWRSGWETAC